MKVPDLTDYVDHFRTRVVQDALAEATGDYWTRRAAVFEAAMPRPGDFTGEATPEQLEEQRGRLAATALACRERATIAMLQEGAPVPRPAVICQTCGTPTSPWSCSCGATRVGEAA